MGEHAGIARPVGYRCPATLVPESIERLLREYLGSRNSHETLRAWFRRHGNDELRAYLAGEPVPEEERDQPSGHVPHAVAE